jgi:hypothetical protein
VAKKWKKVAKSANLLAKKKCIIVQAMSVLAHRAPGCSVWAYVLHPAICIAVTRSLASDSEANARYSKNPTDRAS